MGVTKLPPGMLGNNSEELRNQIANYVKQKQADAINEAHPAKRASLK